MQKQMGEMEKLKLVIGLAPSEMSYKDLLVKLSQERERMSTMLSKPVRTKRKSSTPRKSKSKRLSAKEVKEFDAILKGLL